VDNFESGLGWVLGTFLLFNPTPEVTSNPMKTLDLQQAAEFLHMNAETLRARAKTGVIPGAKPGKAWVFLEEDLVEYIRSHYADTRQAVQVSAQEVSTWHCTDVTAVRSGGHDSPHPADDEYESLLGLKTA